MLLGWVVLEAAEGEKLAWEGGREIFADAGEARHVDGSYLEMDAYLLVGEVPLTRYSGGARGCVDGL